MSRRPRQLLGRPRKCHIFSVIEGKSGFVTDGEIPLAMSPAGGLSSRAPADKSRSGAADQLD